MASISIVLVQPKYTGNIGAVSRVMKNFGFYDLVLVEPPQLDDEAFSRAKHAYDVLESAKTYADLESTITEFDMLVGTTGIDTEKEKESLRRGENPIPFARDILQFPGKIGIMFGREDTGLYNEELALCDRLVTIPTSPEYPVLNLSHAVCVILYTLYIKGFTHTDKTGDYIGENEKERVMALFKSILDDIDYPEHKKEKTTITFRRILGRASTTPWDYHRIMGVLSRIDSKFKE